MFNKKRPSSLGRFLLNRDYKSIKEKLTETKLHDGVGFGTQLGLAQCHPCDCAEPMSLRALTRQTHLPL
jgi:hypothetical protein